METAVKARRNREPNPDHRDTEDTEKDGSSRKPLFTVLSVSLWYVFLRALSASVVTSVAQWFWVWLRASAPVFAVISKGVRRD
jgi:hypothetical protein